MHLVGHLRRCIISIKSMTVKQLRFSFALNLRQNQNLPTAYHN